MTPSPPAAATESSTEPPPPPQPPPGFRLLAGEKTLSLSKALLQKYSPEEDPFFCYKLYMSRTVSFNIDHGMVSTLDDQALEILYMADDPLSNPRFFAFDDGGDLCKLQHVIGRSLVILRRAKDRDQKYHKVHDTRAMDLTMEEGDERQQLWYGDRVDRFLLEWSTARKEWFLFEQLDPGTSGELPGYNQLMSEMNFFTYLYSRFTGCLLSTVCLALGIRAGTVEAHHAHCDGCPSLAWLTSNEGCADLTSVLRAANYAKFQIVLCSHLRSRPRARLDDHLLPASNTFGIHAIWDDSGMASDLTSEAILVALTIDGDCYLVGDDYRKAVLVDAGAAGSKKKSKRRYPGSANVAGIDTRASRVRIPPTAKSNACPCRPCVEASNYEHNLPERGPQKAMHSALSLPDLLRMCGLWTDDVASRIRDCCQISTSTYDLETYAKKMCPPKEAAPDLPNFGGNPETLTQCSRPRMAYSVHRPLMLGYYDEMAARASEPVTIFHAEERDSGRSMVDAFLTKLLERREEATCMKFDLLSDLTEKFDAYKRAHFKFWEEARFLPKGFDYDQYLLDGEIAGGGFHQDQVDEEAAAAVARSKGCKRRKRRASESTTGELTEQAVLELAADLSDDDVAADDDEAWEDMSDDAETVCSVDGARKRRASASMFAPTDECDRVAIAVAADRKKARSSAVRRVKLSFAHSLLGLTSSRIQSLCTRYVCMAFNASG
jgi:hypothetical protein